MSVGFFVGQIRWRYCKIWIYCSNLADEHFVYPY